MIHSKNKKSGFTLIEVLFSTAIVGIVLIPVYGLQGQIMARIVKAANSAQRMFVAFDFFLDAQSKLDENEKKIEKKSDDPPMQMAFALKDIPGKSSLGKEFNNLRLEKASWEWQVDGKKRTGELVSIMFEPPKPEPEKEEKESKGKEAASAGAQQKVPAGGKK